MGRQRDSSSPLRKGAFPRDRERGGAFGPFVILFTLFAFFPLRAQESAFPPPFGLGAGGRPDASSFAMPLLSTLSFETGAAEPRTFNPILVGALATLVPGAGHALLGEALPGIAAFAALGPITARYYWTTDNFLLKAVKVNLFTASRNLYWYSVFDAYQRALDRLGRPDRVVDIPRYSLLQLAGSLFLPETYRFERRLTPVLFATWAAAPVLRTIVRVARSGLSPDLTLERALISIPLILLQTMLIGMGEEAFFRGFVFPAAAEATGSVLAGNLIQAAYFGLGHTTFASRLGITAFPPGTGAVFVHTSTIDAAREYVAPSSPSDGGDVPDLLYFLSTFATGYVFGTFVAEEPNGLLLATALHTIVDASLVLGDLLTTGNTGRFYLEIGWSLPVSTGNQP